MKHYGDISQISGHDIEPVDVVTFGSPCTDMSVAGKRAGLVSHPFLLAHFSYTATSSPIRITVAAATAPTSWNLHGSASRA